MPYATNDQTRDNASKKERPVDEVRFGRVKVVVWKNQTAKGDMLSFVPVKLYRQDGDDQWKETNNLGVGDLLPMAEALREAYRRAALAD